MTDSLRIDTGEIRLAINDDPNRVIAFNPEDLVFVEKFYGLHDELIALDKDFRTRGEQIEASDMPQEQKALQSIALAKELHIAMRHKIDHVFGEGTSQIVFGDTYTFRSMESFFEGIAAFINPVRVKHLEGYLPPNGNGKKSRARARKK